MAIKRIGPGFEFDKSIKAYQKFKQEAPKVIAEESKNHFLEGFRKGGGQTDASRSGWEPREPRKNEGGKQKSHLTLRSDLKTELQNNGVKKATFKEIIIAVSGSVIPYADRHNEGITDKKGRAMPKREFIGDSKELNEKNKKTLVKMLAKVFNV
jgi:phage gpG-like protein